MAAKSGLVSIEINGCSTFIINGARTLHCLYMLFLFIKLLTKVYGLKACDSYTLCLMIISITASS